MFRYDRRVCATCAAIAAVLGAYGIVAFEMAPGKGTLLGLKLWLPLLLLLLPVLIL